MSKIRHAVDAHVGKRLRLRRGLMGWSQEKLGAAVGLTFQQIQKYEKGTNRISCSRLYEFALLLEVPANYFFDDLPGDIAPIPGKNLSVGGNALDAVLTATPDRGHRDTLELVRAFAQLPDAVIRHSMVRLVEAVVASRAKVDQSER